MGGVVLFPGDLRTVAVQHSGRIHQVAYSLSAFRHMRRRLLTEPHVARRDQVAGLLATVRTVDGRPFGHEEMADAAASGLLAAMKPAVRMDALAQPGVR